MTKKVSDINDLTPPERAAAMLLILGERSADIMETFEEFEVRMVSRRMSRLGILQSNVVETLCTLFANKMAETGEVMGSLDSTEKFLMNARPDIADKVLNELKGPRGRTMWDKLSNIDVHKLASYLKNEYPQTAAVVLSMLKPSHAAQVIITLPEACAWEIIQRMLSIDNVKKDMLDELEKTLKIAFMPSMTESKQWHAKKIVAELFNNFDRQTEEHYMKRLEDLSEEEAQKIRSLMFTFADLNKLDATSMQQIIRTVDKTKLPMALKGAPKEIQDLFFNNMSERASNLLKEELEAFGPIKVKDVEAAQLAIVIHVKAMLDEGSIIIEEESDDEFI